MSSVHVQMEVLVKADGTWLRIKPRTTGREALIRLEDLAKSISEPGHVGVIGMTIYDFIDDVRAGRVDQGWQGWTWHHPPTRLQVGDRVRTRGDCGGIGGMVVSKVHNDWYCEVTQFGFIKRHFNMWFLEKVP